MQRQVLILLKICTRLSLLADLFLLSTVNKRKKTTLVALQVSPQNPLGRNVRAVGRSNYFDGEGMCLMGVTRC